MEQILYYFGQILTAKGIKALFSAIVLVISWLVGGVNEAGMALFSLMVADYTLGFTYAWKQECISKKKLRNGVSKFLTYGITIIVGNLLDIVFFHKSTVDYGWRNALIVYLSVNEALSVCKHLINFNVPLPQALVQKLENYRDDINYGKRKTDVHLEP